MFIILLLLLLPIINAIIDYDLIDRGVGVNHTKEVIIRTIVISLIALISGSFIPTFLLGAIIFWIVFELELNLLRGLSPLYVGYTAKTDKLIRKLFPNKPELSLLTIKIIILSCVTYLKVS